MVPSTPMSTERDSGSSHMRTRARRTVCERGGVTMVWLMDNPAGRAELAHQTPSRQNLFRRFHRKAHNICKRPLPAGNDQLPALLNAVGPSLVEWVHNLKIVIDHRVVERPEGHLARHALVHAYPVPMPPQRHPRKHRVRPPRELPEHRPCLDEVARLVQ